MTDRFVQCKSYSLVPLCRGEMKRKIWCFLMLVKMPISDRILNIRGGHSWYILME